jgi:hypothetical protein
MATAKKGTTGVKRERGPQLTVEQIQILMEQWNSRPVEWFAAEFGVAVSTINNTAATIRKIYPDQCAAKGRAGTKKTLIEMAFKNLQAKKQ